MQPDIITDLSAPPATEGAISPTDTDLAAPASGTSVPPAEEADGSPNTPYEGDKTDANAPDAQPPVGSDQWFDADSRRFASDYPDVDRQALFRDQFFLDYAQGKVGTMPLGNIYAGYMRLVQQLGRRQQVQAARQASPGSLRQVTVDAADEYFTLQQMQSMSAQYIEQHWDKVQQSLKRLSDQQ